MRAVTKYADKAARLSAWVEENLPEGLTVFDFPKEYWHRLRTTNNLERLSQEIKSKILTRAPDACGAHLSERGIMSAFDQCDSDGDH
jgi:transposase-like protein